MNTIPAAKATVAGMTGLITPKHDGGEISAPSEQQGAVWLHAIHGRLRGCSQPTLQAGLHSTRYSRTELQAFAT